DHVEVVEVVVVHRSLPVGSGRGGNPGEKERPEPSGGNRLGTNGARPRRRGAGVPGDCLAQTRLTPPRKRETMKRIRKRKKAIFAAPANAEEITPNPSRPAIRAMTRKVMVQPSMMCSLRVL